MIKETASKPIPIIDLIGDMEENYYQLGLKDAEAAKLALEHTESLIKTPWQSVDSGLRFLGRSLFLGSTSWKKRFSPWVTSYAEGLGISPERFMLACLVPELTACLAKWMPQIPKTLLGCSSLFIQDENAKLTHIRTLDFPLGTTFDKNERILRTQFEGQPTIVSYGSAGYPYHALTASTSEGITLALHQKFNDVFDSNGTPIFELVQDMLIRCHDLKSCLSYLRKARSLTTWSFHMGFKNGQVLEADLSGTSLHYNTYQLKKDNFFYFNNKLINPSKEQDKFPPLNFKQYNQWREESALRKIKKFKKKSGFNIEDLLRTWTTLEERKSTGLDVLTPTSLHVCAMEPESGSFHSVLGAAPKTWKGQIQIEEHLWSNSPRREIKGKAKELTNFDKAWMHLLHAQSCHDLGDQHKLHHNLQMAIRKSKGHGLHSIIKFYGLLFTFLSEEHPKALAHLLTDALKLTKEIDKTFIDHNWLLIYRLERLVSQTPSVVAAQIKHPSLAKILEVESSIPDPIYKSVIRSLIHPRIDLLDIIHVHERLDS
ncbi:MAG: hypothetical protein CME71_09860 [Halobacteriovorax sp.]|nr:hypothetical protein [Halobacteriovorax sp.]